MPKWINNFASVLLLGSLSMLLAEVFSGASQAWFANIWGVAITFPLYLLHILFFVWLALKLKKTSLTQLYFFGALFALYESWITKVLWTGYIDLSTPIAGTFMGLGIAEFPMLVFFLHPVLSFITPILVFEILTGKILPGHETILTKSKTKSTLIIIFLVLISTFVALGNKYNLVSANLSVFGSTILILVFYLIAKQSSIKIFEFSKKAFAVIATLLVLIYIWGFLYLAPERTPDTLTPFMSILICYALFIFLLSKSKPVSTDLAISNPAQYSRKDLVYFALTILIFTNLACLFQGISSALFLVAYYTMVALGSILFITSIFCQFFQRNAIKLYV